MPQLKAQDIIKMINERIYLSLGSNIGDSLENLLQAIIALNVAGIKIKDVSGIYLSSPVGYVEQPDFLNMVVSAETNYSPEELLKVCRQTENSLGRVREIRWGPRKIDIDILFYGDYSIKKEELELPHPRLKERAFVLVPLKEIAPEIFEDLKVPIPVQNLCLKIEQTDVKMMLKERGLVF